MSAPTATLTDLLDALMEPGDHVSLCTLTPAGEFRARTVPLEDAREFTIPQDRDLWFGVAPVPAGTATRGTSGTVTRWTALYADLDYKPGGMGTAEAAAAVLDVLDTVLGTPATFPVHSGHGLQPIWPLDAGDPATDLTDPARRLDAVAAMRRWHRFVTHVAATHGGKVDNVSDLARILRVPGSVNHKGAPVPVTCAMRAGRPLTVAEVLDTLEAYGVGELPEDRDLPGDPVAPPEGWRWGTQTCGYVARMIGGWATDTPPNRHPWLLSAAVRLATAHRLGCITEADHTRAWDTLTARFRHLLTTGQARQEHPGEVAQARRDGTAYAAAKSDAQAWAELGHHTHPAPLTEYATGPQDAPTAAGDAPPAPEPTGDDTAPPGASWAPVDLTATIAGLVAGTLTRHAPTIGHRDDGAALFYAGKVNGIAGASGCGKTWTALVVCAQEIAAGAHVLYIDLEDDETGTVGRLLDLGARPADLAARFHYVHPEERHGIDAAHQLATVVTALAPTVVVIDSTGESMALDGDKPNDDDDTARWFRRLPTAVAARGPAVIVLDHVVKADDGGLWPIGSQRKRAAISGAQYMQQVVKSFAKDPPGAAKLVCAKDRHGNYRPGQKVAELTVTPDGGSTHATLRTPPDATTAAGGAFRPTTLMERVSRALEDAGEPLTFRALDSRVVGQQQHITTALDTLVREGYVERTHGPRNSNMHATVRPYRQDTDPLSDAYTARETVSQFSAHPDRVTVSRPKNGDGETDTQPYPGDSRETVGRQSDTRATQGAPT